MARLSNTKMQSRTSIAGAIGCYIFGLILVLSFWAAVIFFGVKLIKLALH